MTAVAFAGAMLAGCASKGYSPLAERGASTMIAPPTGPSPEIVILPPESVPVVGLDRFDGGGGNFPSLTNAIAATVPRPATRAWMSLADWAERSGFGPPRKFGSGPGAHYHIPTQTGLCKLTIGSRLAQWNGISVWLGFAPHLVKGEPRIHSLDAEKLFRPLAQPAAVPRKGDRVVVIDPGHGGADGGTRGARHELEKTFTLDWALRTERRLTNAGWKVFLTRRTDVDVSLTQRVALRKAFRPIFSSASTSTPLFLRHSRPALKPFASPRSVCPPRCPEATSMTSAPTFPIMRSIRLTWSGPTEFTGRS